MPATAPARLLRRGLLPALLGATLVASAPALVAPAAAAEPTSADPAVVAAAADWLADQLSDAGTVVGSYPDFETGEPVEFTDWGRSLDSALALLAAGGQDDVLGRTLHSVEQPDAVAEYTQGAPGEQPNTDTAYVGATAKLAFVTALTGGDATDVGDVDLLAQLASLEQADGRYADRSNYGNFANLYGHAFALLALEEAGRTSSPATVQGLLDAQCPDGSFPQDYEPSEGADCAGQIDATGLVLQALAAIGHTGPEVQEATEWLVAQQQGDGSFPGEAPVNSTGYAVLGLNAVEAATGSAVSWLVGQQNDDGGLRRGAGADTGSDLFATAQALPALDGTTFAGSARTVARVAPPTQQEPDPDPQEPGPSDPGTTDPGTDPGTTDPGTPGPGSPDPGTTDTGTDTGGEAPSDTSVLSSGRNRTTSAPADERVASTGALPRTGTELEALALSAAGLLGTGVLLLLAGCATTSSVRARRRSRHAT